MSSQDPLLMTWVRGADGSTTRRSMNDWSQEPWNKFKPVRTTDMVWDALILALLGACHLFFAPICSLALVDQGLSTLSTELFQLWTVHYGPETFFMLAPALFLLLTAHLLIHPETPEVSRGALGLYAVLLTLGLIHEMRLWLTWPVEQPWIARFAICFGSPGLLVIGAVALQNRTNPSLTSAFLFNGLLVWWLFTTAFPFFVEVWSP